MKVTQAPRRTALADLVAGEIRAEMARQRKTQRDLARRMEVIEAWLSRRLNGHVPLAIDDLDEIAKHLGVSVIDLLRRAEESRPRPTALVARHVVPYRTARGVPSGGRRPVRLCPSPAA